MSTQTGGFAVNWDGGDGGRGRSGRGFQGLVSGLLNLICLLDIQVEIWNSQVDMWLCNSGDRSGMDRETWKSSDHNLSHEIEWDNQGNEAQFSDSYHKYLHFYNKILYLYIYHLDNF